MHPRLLRVRRVCWRSLGHVLTIVASCCALVASAQLGGQGRAMAQERLPPAVVQQADDSCWASLQPVGQSLGGLSCASSSCHGREASRSGGSASRQEFVRWLRHDPHAKAAAILSTTDFAEILAAVSARPDGSTDDTIYAKCAACHDPEGLAAHRQQGNPSPLQAGHHLVHGIGCESCHGPAEKWIGVHYQQGMAAETLTSLGMVDTDNLLTRSRACVACHVGDDTHDMNHDMIAAGHPPLRFEVSAYHDLIETKHWSDRERLETPDFKAQLWLAGQLATADASLGLLESRAERSLQTDGDELPKAPWPEFAEYDCFACHQRLRPQAAAVGVATKLEKQNTGAPSWQPWNALLADRLLSNRLHASDQLAPPSFFYPLQMQMQESFRGSAVEAAKQAHTLRTELRQHPLCDGFRRSEGRTGNVSAQQILATVQLPAAEGWAPAVQELLALKASYLALRDRRPSSSPVTHRGSNARLEREIATLQTTLGFGSTAFDWPTYDGSVRPNWPAPSQAPYSEVHSALRKLASDLQQQVSGQSPRRGHAHE